ncbi:hypothetical protein FQR65_LT07221 [Abscondita terminalis]|nr:hypothetical protein FQR65_LT07221 [Abscondita terminalis]
MKLLGINPRETPIIQLFLSYKSQILRDIRLAELGAIKKAKLKKKQAELKRLKAENEELDIDEDEFLARGYSIIDQTEAVSASTAIMTNTNINNKILKDQDVMLNGILKEQVEKEEVARSVWNTKWGFMRDFDKICIEVASNMGISEDQYRKMVTKKKCAKFDEKIGLEVNLKPSDPVPTTSSGFVGWRCKHINSLEMCGPLYVSPRHTIDVPEVEKFPQTQIMLG